MTTVSSGASEPKGRRLRLARAGLLTLALAAAAGLGLLASACGGSSGTRVAQVASTNTSTSGTPSSNGSSKGNPAAYSACMRKHGVSNFPDPDSQGRIKVTSGVDRNGRRTGVDVNSPQFREAQQACRKLMPGGGRPDPQAQAKREVTAALKFSQCMRSHGVPKYPDPEIDPNGGMKMTIGENMGVDPNSPRFKAAQKTCQKLVPGSPLAVGPAEAP